MKKFNSSRRKLQLSRTTIRKLSIRDLSRINGGTAEETNDGDQSDTLGPDCMRSVACN